MTGTDRPIDPAQLAREVARHLADILAERDPRAASPYLSVPAAAEYVGIGLAAMNKLLAANKIRSLRPVPGRVVIDRRDLDAYVQAATAAPARRRGRPRKTD